MLNQIKWLVPTSRAVVLVLGAVFVALLVGGSLVIAPPIYGFAFVGLTALLMLWVLPDLNIQLDRVLRIVFLLFVVATNVVPYYYTLVIPGLPWINVRRVLLFAMVAMTALLISASSSKRRQVKDVLASSPYIAWPALGFAVVQFLSVLTSISISDSIREYSNSALSWYIPFLCALLVIKPSDFPRLCEIIIACVVVNFALGFAETYVQHPFLHMLLPESVKQQLLLENPRFGPMFTTGAFRNGVYRASSTFIISLSWGEFSAMAAPIAAAFLIDRNRGWKGKFYGVLGLIACGGSVYLSGSRGAYLGTFTSLACFFFVWAYKNAKDSPHLVSGGIVMAFYWMATPAFVLAAMFVGAIRRVVIGGGAVQNSNEGRSIQWALGMPKVWARPLLGYGPSQSGVVVGYYPAGIEVGPTVDSYALTLLVENGIPGFLFFFGTLIAALYESIRCYFASKEPSPYILAFGCAILAFGAYRPFLSQRDNHTFMLIILSLLFIAADASKRLAEKSSENHSKLSRESAKVMA